MFLLPAIVPSQLWLLPSLLLPSHFWPLHSAAVGMERHQERGPAADNALHPAVNSGVGQTMGPTHPPGCSKPPTRIAHHPQMRRCKSVAQSPHLPTGEGCLPKKSHLHQHNTHSCQHPILSKKKTEKKCDTIYIKAKVFVVAFVLNAKEKPKIKI